MTSKETKTELTPFEGKSTNDGNNYEMPLEDQKRNLVYDYLYQDTRRVASFLAQFEAYGVPSQVKATESIGRAEAEKTSLSGGVKVAFVGHGEGARDITVSTDERDAAERTYDPALKHARNLLDFLTDHDMICRDLSVARIGQFVLVSGSLGILDLAMLHIVWDVPLFREMTEKAISGSLESASSGLPKAAQHAAKIQTDKQSKGMLEFIRKLPHVTQARMSTSDGYSIYSALQTEGLTGSTTDLLLKNGIKVPGEWSMLGILDVLPDSDTSNPLEPEAISGPFVSLLNNLVPLIQEIGGRPPHALGITPLIIFRAVVV